MTRAEIREVVDMLEIPIVMFDDRGLEIRRETNPDYDYEAQFWSLYSLAGSPDKIWLRPLAVMNLEAEMSPLPGMPRGPFTTRRALEKALRAWRRGA